MRTAGSPPKYQYHRHHARLQEGLVVTSAAAPPLQSSTPGYISHTGKKQREQVTRRSDHISMHAVMCTALYTHRCWTAASAKRPAGCRSRSRHLRSTYAINVDVRVTLPGDVPMTTAVTRLDGGRQRLNMQQFSPSEVESCSKRWTRVKQSVASQHTRFCKPSAAH